jgi:hypothetical protein
MKRNIILLAFATCLGFSATGMAVPIFSLKDVPAGWDGSFEIKFQNYESFTLNQQGQIDVGSQNYGIVKLTSISDPTTGTDIWQSGDNGAEITGVFNGITVKTITPTLGGDVVDSTGGTLNLYINPNGTFATAGGFGQGAGGYGITGCSVASLCYDGISNAAAGGMFLTLDWAAVGVVADGTITVDGTLSALTTPLTGTAQGYANVTGGDYASHFDTNGQLGGSDVFLQDDVCTPGDTGCVSLTAAGGSPADGGWMLRSNDPVRGAYIPEPATLGLLGIGLLGIGIASRRRKA